MTRRWRPAAWTRLRTGSPAHCGCSTDAAVLCGSDRPCRLPQAAAEGGAALNAMDRGDSGRVWERRWGGQARRRAHTPARKEESVQTRGRAPGRQLPPLRRSWHASHPAPSQGSEAVGRLSPQQHLAGPTGAAPAIVLPEDCQLSPNTTLQPAPTSHRSSWPSTSLPASAPAQPLESTSLCSWEVPDFRFYL